MDAIKCAIPGQCKNLYIIKIKIEMHKERGMKK
jgi:hypothetical protein